MQLFNVFTRRVWREEGEGVYTPDGASPKRTIKQGVTEEQAWEICKAKNALAPPYGTKAYYAFRWTEYTKVTK